MIIDKKPIVKLYFMKPKEAWYSLSKEEQQRILKKDHEISGKLNEKFGIKKIIVCDCFWSTEDWILFGVEEYPNTEAVQEATKALRKIGFFRYFESRIFLGTPGVPEELKG